ncbi:MAG: methyltransferase domain-containing protein [Opitutales bacterium]|nr:methyltransferase domain-containing protein [Opitutales bacterium]
MPTSAEKCKPISLYTIMRLTELTHTAISKVLQPGELAIDATIGNGHDTSFLARITGPSGEVHGFDIQADALAKTQQLLEDENLAGNVTLHHAGHENMDQHLPPGTRDKVTAIIFNLGYLPGGDKSCITCKGTTLKALHLAFNNYLRPGGILSILCYPGHPGGDEESKAVKHWLSALSGATVETHASGGPILHLVRKAGL